MALIRINPTKMLVGGDQEKAKAFLGPARSQMEILKNQMSFQNLTQGVRRIWLNEDTHVECIKCYNYQECRIWVRPQISKEFEAQGIYFYIHIVKPNIGANYGEDINRLILWRLRTEEKADINLSQPIENYYDHGKYSDGKLWGILSSGAVILDVDLASNTVYSESGIDDEGNPILVDTELNEEAQILMAKKYIATIYPTNSANVNYVPGFTLSGDLYSPFASIRACHTAGTYTYVEDEPEVFFNDSLVIDLGAGVTEDYYHVRDEVLDIFINPTPWCAEPEAEFNRLNWIDLTLNANKYLPTTQILSDTDYYQCGNFCFSNLNFSEDSYYEWSRKACHNDVSLESGEHYAGSWFIDQDYASFFVSLYGNHTNFTQQRKAVLDGYDWDDSSWPQQGNISGYSYGSVVLNSGASYFSTPLEKSIALKKLTWVNDDLSSAQQDFYKWAGNRRNASISYMEAEDYTLTGGKIDQWVKHHPANWWSGYPNVSTIGPGPNPPNTYLRPNLALMSLDLLNEDQKDFNSSIRIFQSINTYHVPLIVFYEVNHQGKIGHAFGHNPATNSQNAWFYNEWPEEAEVLFQVTTHPNNVGVTSNNLPIINAFQVAIVFNLIQITRLSTTDLFGNVTYWDIHTEREDDQDDDTIAITDKRDNHNREKLLGAYVSAILKDIKQLPDMINSDGSYKLLKDCELSILTGFVYQ